MALNIDIQQIMKDIPPLPDVVNDIIMSLNDDSANIEILTNKIMMDPALATRVLKIANSPFYGLSGKISSLKEACIVLGSYSIKNLAVAAGIVNKLSKSGNAINTVKLWEHAVGTGAAARVIAEKKGLDYEIAFTSGLLHDVGKIILDINYPVEYKQVMEYRASHNCFLCEAENDVLGITHAEIGELCASHWKLPDVIRDVISNHHKPDNSDAVMPSIIHLADILCRSLEIGYPGDGLIPCIHPIISSHNIVSTSELSEILPVIDSLSQTLIKLIVSK